MSDTPTITDILTCVVGNDWTCALQAPAAAQAACTSRISAMVGTESGCRTPPATGRQAGDRGQAALAVAVTRSSANGKRSSRQVIERGRRTRASAVTRQSAPKRRAEASTWARRRRASSSGSTRTVPSCHGPPPGRPAGSPPCWSGCPGQCLRGAQRHHHQPRGRAGSPHPDAGRLLGRDRRGPCILRTGSPAPLAVNRRTGQRAGLTDLSGVRRAGQDGSVQSRSPARRTPTP